MYVFWHFAFLPVWPLFPLESARLAAIAGIMLEIFVNPLNLVGPLWPRVGVILPIVLMFQGGVLLWRRSWTVWTMLVSPIGLAMVASTMKRYPLHGRLILEIVPALFLLIALGTDWWRRRDDSGSRRVYWLVLFLLLCYPCLTALNQAANMRYCDFNRHGDLHKNLFID